MVIGQLGKGREWVGGMEVPRSSASASPASSSSKGGGGEETDAEWREAIFSRFGCG